MNEPILAAKKLASELVERRLPILENELSKLLRELSPEEKLEIIQQVSQENVRAAAALAARGHLPVAADHLNAMVKLIWDAKSLDQSVLFDPFRSD